MTSQAAPATHTTQPEDTSQGNRQLSGAGLLLARGAWLLVASFIVLFYLVGTPTRLAQLGRPLPPNRPGGLMILSQAQIDALAQVGIPLNAYIAYILSLELLLACTCVAIGALIFVRQSRSLAAILASIMLMAFGSSETTFMASVARVYLWLDKPVEMLQATGSGLTLIVFYTFPSGYFVPRWTRPLAWLWSAQVLAWLLVPSMPFSIVHLDIFNHTPVLSTLFVMSWSATGVYALFHRYRHVADTEQRQQMKWAVLGLLIAFGAAALSYSAPAWLRPWFADSGALGEVLYDMIARPVYWLCITLTPVCFAVAILRYRLWSIEPIINRVLVYGLLTGSLALVYIGGVVLLQAALRTLTVQDSTLAVMGATLVSALLFQPLRRRVQAVIDRSFDRTRVDARTALAAFTREIRTIIDLPTLLGALVQRTTDLLKITHGAVFLQQDGGFALQAAQNLPPTDTLLALDDTALAELRAGVALASWFTSFAVNVAREAMRARARRRWLLFLAPHALPEPIDGGAAAGPQAHGYAGADVDARMDAGRALRATYEVLERMGIAARTVFALRHLEDMELTEVASACGVSLATVKRRLAAAEQTFLARARRHPQLAAWLEEEEGARWR